MESQLLRLILGLIHFGLSVVLFFCHHTTIITHSISEKISLSDAMRYYNLEERTSFEAVILIGFCFIFILPFSFLLFTSKKQYKVIHLFGMLLSVISIFHYCELKFFFVVLPTWAPHEYQHSLVFYLIYLIFIYCFVLHLLRVIQPLTFKTKSNTMFGVSKPD